MKRIYIKEEACIACHLCEIYCQIEHSKSKEAVKAFKKEFPRPLPQLRVEKKGPLSFSVRCRHCDEPSCVYACLTGALSRDAETGLVMVDKERCIGCWTCILACPFGVIKQDSYSGTIAKCDLCAGKDPPACVADCPNEALVYIEDKESVPA